MTKVYAFHKKDKPKSGIVIYIQSFIKNYVLDLTEFRNRPERQAARMQRRKAELGLRLIVNPYTILVTSNVEKRADLKLVVNNDDQSELRKKA